MVTNEANKAVVLRFNKEVIGGGDEQVFRSLVKRDFVNRSAPPGSPTDADGMIYFFNQILRPGIPDLQVEVHDQVAEGDKVVTRKTLVGTHGGPLLGIAPTRRRIAIDVLDVIRLEDGQYAEHWGLTTLDSVLAALRQP